MPAELCYDAAKVSRQDRPKEERESSIPAGGELSRIPAEQETSVDPVVQHAGEYVTNGRFMGGLSEQDSLDSSESSSSSECDPDPDPGESHPGGCHCTVSTERESSELCENHEAFTPLQVMPDLCRLYEQDHAWTRPETLCEREPELEPLLEQSVDFYDLDLYPQCTSQDLNAVPEPDSELCGLLEECELCDQTVITESHEDGLEPFSESLDSELSGSLEEQTLASQTGTTGDSELPAEVDSESYTSSSESSDPSQFSEELPEDLSEQTPIPESDQHEDYDEFFGDEAEGAETVMEQCSRCGKYFERRDALERPDTSEALEPLNCSEDLQQCSVLPREDVVPKRDTGDIKRRLDCDMMFLGSMETFEARWLSQFLAVDAHPNDTFMNRDDPEEQSRDPSPGPSGQDSEGSEIEVQSSDELVVLCEECAAMENAPVEYDVPSGDLEDETLKPGCDEKSAEESLVQASSLDESSEEDYADCMDGKSQGSTETDVSFKSCAHDPEPEETLPDRVDHDEREQSFSSSVQDSCEDYSVCSDASEEHDHDERDGPEEDLKCVLECDTTEKNLKKSYAEALCSGLSLESGQSLSQRTYQEPTGTGHVKGFALNQKDGEDLRTFFEVMEGQDSEIIDDEEKDQEVVDSHEPVGAVEEICGFPTELEDASDSSPEHETSPEASEMFTEVSRSADKDVLDHVEQAQQDHFSGESQVEGDAGRPSDTSTSPLEYDEASTFADEDPEVRVENLCILTEAEDDVTVDEPDTCRDVDELKTCRDVVIVELETCRDVVVVELETCRDVTVDEPDTCRDVDELETCRDVVIDELETCRDVVIDELETHRDVVIDELETCRDVTVDELETHRDVVIDELETHRDVTVDELETRRDVVIDELETCRDVVIDEPETCRDVVIDELETCRDVVIDELETCRDVTVDELETHRDVVIDELETCRDVVIDELETCRDVVIDELETCRDVTVDELETCRDVVIDEPETCRDVTVDEPDTHRDVAVDEPETCSDMEAPQPDAEDHEERCEEPIGLIHQVSRTDDSGRGGFIQPPAEHGDTSEDTEASDEDEDDYPEFCECEFCVIPVEQVPAKPLLPQIKSKDAGKICVVIDLDETLVHSSFKPVNNADFIIPVEIDGAVHQVYVLKRPHVDEFLKRMGELFECVLFTASLAKYADPVSDLLDKWGAFRCRLFRESCVFHRGNYVKDLSRLGRDLNKVIIVDNSPASYIFHPDNAVPVASWFDDMSDTELLDLIPFFERLSKVDDVYAVLKQQRTSS
ncbi:uncharacterized protein LOC134324428 [Trichomycterus rosablanca]|uniref:uncharacterized protein LOC134324428 n=1 Tax=Trichomycterus rosablanca TaxID=2290929 RepID=UPI002F35C878